MNSESDKRVSEKKRKVCLYNRFRLHRQKTSIAHDYNYRRCKSLFIFINVPTPMYIFYHQLRNIRCWDLVSLREGEPSDVVSPTVCFHKKQKQSDLIFLLRHQISLPKINRQHQTQSATNNCQHRVLSVTTSILTLLLCTDGKVPKV